MAHDDEWEFLPDGWSSYEKEAWAGSLGSLGSNDDRVAQALFNEGYFNFDLPSDQINAIRDALDDYLFENYGIDFNDIFDWEAYREAYSDAG